MSKDTPEVGDMWKDDSGYKVLILKTFMTYSEAISENFAYRIIYNKGFAPKEYKDISNYSYLGKSKANIDDLFKTEDNGKCIEDNTPHAESTVLFKTENEE